MVSTRPTKRMRSASVSSCSVSSPVHSDCENEQELLTAPASDAADDDDDDCLSSCSDSHDDTDLLFRATRVLATEAAALQSVTQLYKTCPSARSGFTAAVAATIPAQRAGGKLVFCGVGKSAYIAQKLTATCKSLSIRASYMHACEAIHGDLGDVHENDIVLFVSYSGRTPELLSLLLHIPMSTRIMSLSSQRSRAKCGLLADRRSAILITAPIPENEESTFGVAAPTTSTTVALAVGDMFALTVANELHQETTSTKFKRNHPGGAIGVDNARLVDKLLHAQAGAKAAVTELPSPCMSEADK